MLGEACSKSKLVRVRPPAIPAGVLQGLCCAKVQPRRRSVSHWSNRAVLIAKYDTTRTPCRHNKKSRCKRSRRRVRGGTPRRLSSSFTPPHQNKHEKPNIFAVMNSSTQYQQ